MSLFERLLCKLFPHRDIPAPDGRLYMRRWFLWPRRMGLWSESNRVMWVLHKICLSDFDRSPHSHPAAFTTRILAGGYEEQVFRVDPVYGRVLAYKRDMKPGRCEHIAQGHVHRVTLYGDRPCWSLVHMQPAGGAWGFVKPDGTLVDATTYRAQEYARVAQKA